jgi:hypothetical protein
MPRLVQAPIHKAEVNCAPLSVVTVAGTPKRATQLAMKASVHVLASMLRRGTASIHLVDPGLAIKNPPKNTHPKKKPKNQPKKTHK